MPRYEYRDHKSSKFWEIERDGSELTTRWGKIGTKGQSKTKSFPSEDKASSEYAKQIKSKTGKGYVEVGAGAAPSPAPAAAPAKTAPASSPAASGSKPKPKAAAPASPASSAPTGAAPKQDLADGEEIQVKGSGSRHYTLRNVGGVFSCTCPAWRNQSLHIDRRTCKHLRKFRGEAAEEARLGALPVRATSSSGAKPDAPPLLLAHRWEEQDPKGWWMSEKLDGVRAYWDGERFMSRLGNEFLAPKWFTEGLPDFPLDGELFGGRGKFQSTVSIARRADAGKHWRALSYVIFDAPALTTGFEQRIAHLQGHFGGSPWEFASVLDHRECEGVDDLRRELARIEGLGGEGLMLRRPGSSYVAGRSTTLLKVKSFFDTEARIVGHQPGTGRHKGRLGALELELPDGTRFKAGTGLSDAQRDSPPDVGEIVTVRYQELTDAGVPRFPVFVGVRDDFDWDAALAKARKG